MKSENADLQVIFAEALRLRVPAEREAYLDQACAGNPALRQDIQSLLVADAQAGDFLNETHDLPAADCLVERAGTMVGRYKLLEKIGEGGFGVVWMAEQEEPVRRRVALKIIKLGMDTKEVVARFEAERQALAMMGHPHIARVFDGGATDTGRPYFVMELVKGIPITEFCDANALSTRERLRLFMQVCHAVQHAHQKGVIHRDLKPSNILVTVQDDKPAPKVIDFGVAKATQARLTEKTLFTGFQQWIGTPAYMSPEQAGLGGYDVDTRSDIYSLGVLLYELLTGVTPFDRETLAKAALDEIRRMIRETEPAIPSTRVQTLGQRLADVARHRKTEPAALSRLIRGDLDWIAMKCLEKDRGRRYDTANNLALDIEHHLRHEPVSAAAPSPVYMAQKFIRRHKAGLAVAAALVLLLTAGVVVSVWQAVRATRAEREQTRLRQIAETKEKKSEQTARFLKDMLEGVGPSVALGRNTTMLKEILDRTAERVGKDLKDQPAVEAELRGVIGKVYYELGEYEKASVMHRKALAIHRELFGNEDLNVATSLYNLGFALAWQRELPEAETVVRESLAIRRKLLGSQHPEVARSLYALAFVFSVGGKPAEAETLYREALAVFKNASGNEGPDVASTLNDLAFVLRSQRKMEEAEAVQREALGMRRKADQEFLDPLDREELLKHLDQIVKVKGQLMSFGQAKAGNYNYLHFSENYQAALSLTFHLTDNPAEFRREALQEYVKKTVIVEGQMSVHKGQPQIMIYSLAQIKVVEETQSPQ